MEQDKFIRFSVSLPEPLLKALDGEIVYQGYVSRSEFIRDLIREQILERRWEENEGEVVGVLTMIYDHHEHELTQQLLAIQHDASVHILCSTHVHLDHHNCLETIILQGDAADIRAITTKIAGLEGVKFAKLVKTGALAH
ncbi:MAG: nickel-responsive transcriptional regulator NikR [Campylobacterales bacterium]